MLSSLLCCFGGTPTSDPSSSASSATLVSPSHDGKEPMMPRPDAATPSLPNPLQSNGTLDKCVFCNPTADNFDIVLQDDRFVVFSDRSPAAQVHLLAVPRWHVENVKALRDEEGAKLVQDLLSVGTRALALVDAQQRKDATWHMGEPKETRFGFHIYPFNSVNHIHLHCLALPFRSSIKALKYRLAPGNATAIPPTHKGWGWFVTADQSTAILREGGTVQVEPC